MEGFVNLNLGSGQGKINDPEWINIDNRSEMNPDLCCDVTKGLPFKNNSVDFVRCFDILEHIPAGKDCVNLIEEIYRVLKPGGIFHSHTPDAEFGQAAFQDPFHISFWVKNSWLYYSHDAFRSLYGIKAKFRIDSIIRHPELSPDCDVYHLEVTAVKI
jgi:predicted SAM-dependent methyltransferase